MIIQRRCGEAESALDTLNLRAIGSGVKYKVAADCDGLNPYSLLTFGGEREKVGGCWRNAVSESIQPD